jgi:hypothetical protein
MLAPLAWAQTGPDLLIKPWDTGQILETQADAAVLAEGSTKNSEDFNLSFYDFSGRYRVLREHRADPRFGWNFTKIRTSGDPALPNDLIDTSVGFSTGIADWNGWLAGISLGVGYAGAGAFDDGNAWYGKADLAFGRTIDNNSSIGIVIDYDGNRTFMPDVPLPGFAYTMRLDDKTSVQIGFPYTSIEYKFNEQLTLMAEFYVPDSLTARVDYTIVKGLGVFAEYASRQEAFHWDELSSGNDRVIYDSRRAEAGVRWTPVEWLDLIVAGGYAFSQEFNVGFDTRDQDRIARPSDEAYVRFGFELWY